MTTTTFETSIPPVRSVRVLADLLETGDVILDPTDEQPGVVSKINRLRKRLRLTLVVELVDGRSFEISGSRFVFSAAPPAPAQG